LRSCFLSWLTLCVVSA